MKDLRLSGTPEARAKSSASSNRAWNALGILPVMLILGDLHAQDPIWSSGDQVIQFPVGGGSLTTSNLPTSFSSLPNNLEYQASGADPTTLNQNVQYDDQGNVLFFIVDSRVYNAQGLLLADNDTDPGCQVCLATENAAKIGVVPVPGSCSQYFVITGGHTGDRDNFDNAYMQIGVLDLALTNDLIAYGSAPPPMGRFTKNTDPGYADLIADAVNSMTWVPVNDYVWGYTMQNASLSSNDHEAVMFDALEVGPSGRVVFTLNSARSLEFWIFPEPNYPSSQAPVRILSLDKDLYGWSNYGDAYRSLRGEVEAQLVGTTLRVAHGVYSGDDDELYPNAHRVLKVAVWDLNGAGLTAATPTLSLTSGPFNPRHCTVDDYYESGGIPVDFAGNDIIYPRVCGLEFSPSGQYLYFLKSSYSALFDYNLGYIDATAGFALAVSDLGIGPNSYTRTLADGELEINVAANGVGNAIYAIRAEGDPAVYHLAALTSPDAPSFLNWSDVATLSHIGVRTGIGSVEYRLLDMRVGNSTHQTFLQSVVDEPACCMNLQVSSAVTGYSYTGTNTYATAWSPGSNPFTGSPAEVVFTDDLVVEPGALLYVNGLTLRFADNARLIIRPGGQARFYNSTLTSVECPNMRWPGVAVNGTSSNLTQAPSMQGVLYLHNSEVSNARNGVWCATMSSGAVLPSGNGGYVTAHGTVFRNNLTGVRIRDFHRFNGSVPQANKSGFTNCEFITDADWPDFGLNHPIMHSDLCRVDRIKFQNCAFRNDAWAYFPITWWGNGIVAKNATINCTGGMNYATNRFVNLKVGIDIMNMTPSFTNKVDGMGFEDCWYGIFDRADRFARIVNNRFEMNNVVLFPSASASVGLTLWQSNLYTVERNTFIEDPPTTVSPSLGIWFYGAAYDENQIYDNVFENLNAGCMVEGDHRSDSDNYQPGLQMLCGDHYDCLGDQVMKYMVSPTVTQIRAKQGSSSDVLSTANNTFNKVYPPAVCGTQWEVWVDPNFTTIEWPPDDVTYYWFKQPLNPEMRQECVEMDDLAHTPITTVGNDYHLVSVLPTPLSTTFDKEVHCAQGILDAIAPDPGSQMVEYGQRLTELASAIDAYNGQVDGGSSPDLEAEINYSTPWHPSYYLRDLLLGNAPLSDHILFEAIHRGQPMDPWHLTQVLIQNSPLTGFVRQELESSGVLNAFFLNLLDQFNNGVSLRGVLEQEIVLRGEQKSRLQQTLISHWANDTITEGRIDTIDMILALDTFGLAERYRYWLALDRGDFTLAGQIQAGFSNDPNAALLVELGDMYMTLNGNWEDATLSQIQGLVSIAYAGLDGSAFAWSILQELDELDSLPPAILPEMYRAPISESFDRGTVPGSIQFAAYPNPASTQVMLTLPLGAENGELQVFDAQGRLVQTVSLADQKGFITLPLQGWAEGLYLARLDFDGFAAGETKFTIVR